jgi:hypothetical protein
MKRPLVAVVSCYTIGLLLGGAFQPPLTALLIVAFVVLVLALALEKFRPFLIWPLLALAGWINLASRIAIVSPDDLRTLIGNDAAIVTVQGTLTETPHLKIAGRDEQETEHSLAKVRVAEIRRDEIWQPAFGTIIVSTPNPLPETFFAGQPVEISGVIARPPPPLADGLFDYRYYLETRGIFYELKTDSTNDWKLLEPHFSKPPLTDRFLNWSKHTLAFGLPVEDKPLHLLWAMTLGCRFRITSKPSCERRAAEATGAKENSGHLHAHFRRGDNYCTTGQVDFANNGRAKIQLRRLVKLTETRCACGIGNFFTSTVTLSGLNSDKIISQISAASFSISFQLFPSPNFKSRWETVK